MALATTELVGEPGIYRMSADVYHADPVAGGSLSSTGARKLLPPGCPAKFRWDQDHGQPPKAAFDHGHAAHKLVLGDGPELVVVDADSWRTNAAKAAAKQAREAGQVPLLPQDMAMVQAMAEAIRSHPIASTMFAVEMGEPELTLIWRDQATGVWCRARPDWLPHRTGQGRLIISDYKTCVSAESDALAKTVHTYGYHQQADWIMSGCAALGLADPRELAFLFIAQEKTPPYVVTVFELDPIALQIGEARNRRALEIYRRCSETGAWPAYESGVAQLSLPMWAEIHDREEYDA